MFNLKNLSKVALFPFLIGVGFAQENQDLEKIINFFSVQGQIIAKAKDDIYVNSKGLPYFKVGFPVAIYRGTYVENPLTHTKSFVIIGETGKGYIYQSFPTNSLVKVTQNQGVKVGDIVRLDVGKICFEGSDFVFQKLSQTLPVVKTKDIHSCRWSIEETNQGFKIYLNQQEVYFVQKSLPGYAFTSNPALDLKDLKIFANPYLLETYREIPTAIDSGYIVDNKIPFVAVGFPEKVVVYQKVGDSLKKITEFPTPAGILVGLQLVKINGQGYIIGNMFTIDAQPAAFIAKLVGTNAVIVAQNIPYYLAVLNKNAPEKTFIAQRFSEGSFGDVYSVQFNNDVAVLGKKLNMPAGFRADSAVMTDDNTLAFIDSGGTLRIYKGDLQKGFKHIVDIEGDFGKSYVYINIPDVMGTNTLTKFFFNPRPQPITLFGFKGFVVVKNIPEQVVPILGSKFVKYKKGKLYFVAQNREGYYQSKPILGAVFEDAVDGFTISPDGTPYLITGKRNPILFRTEGDLYKLQFRYY